MPQHLTDEISRLEAVLCDPAFDGQVEMVLSRTGPNSYRAAAVDGSVEFSRRPWTDGRGVERWRYDVTSVTGRNPLADTAVDRFSGHDAERVAAFPARTANAYPYALDSAAQFFDGAHAPEVFVLHTAAHHFDDNLGQHGSLGVVQARAPFIAAGSGIRADGIVDRAGRMVDIAPTIAAVLGLDEIEGVGPTGAGRPDALLARQDGDPDRDLLDGNRADHVVVFLLDGCNANLLADVVAAGEAPNLAAVAARGTTYRHGVMASLPTATLANHTCASTGAHPGHSGIVHNTWYDRSSGTVPDLLSMDQIFTTMQHLDPSVESIHQAIHRCRPDAFTSATFEFCDVGADVSPFAEIRAGRPPAFVDLAAVPHVSAEHAGARDEYAFMSIIDHTSVARTVELWDRVDGNPLPILSWVSIALTDEAGHMSGPHGEMARASIRDTDARVGDVLAAVERSGALDRTAIFVFADHGMEQNDPGNDSSWSGALTSTGVALREVGEGFVYLG